MKRLDFIKNIGINHLINYPTPSNLNYFWGFGFAAGLFLTIQILTGVILAMHYIPNVDLAFESLEHIMRDVNGGWFLRYLHANGASFFFICIYVHMFKNIYYRAYKYPRGHVWNSGILIFLISMATAFIGYVLPWGQMSFWGATVITNLLTALPYVGLDLVYWIWGGFSVGNSTLNRFFSIHYILPLIIAALVLLHLALLHEAGSNNPLGIDTSHDKISFYPYFWIKDFYTFFLILFIYLFIVFFYPDLLGHSDNYIKANPLVTPVHIVPEWYFLPFYAILRSVPDKLAGVFLMFFSILILFLLPVMDRSTFLVSPKFSFFFGDLFWYFFFNSVFLGILGAMPVEEPYVTLSRISTAGYFLFFILVYLFSFFENFFLLNALNSRELTFFTKSDHTTFFDDNKN